MNRQRLQNCSYMLGLHYQSHLYGGVGHEIPLSNGTNAETSGQAKNTIMIPDHNPSANP